MLYLRVHSKFADLIDACVNKQTGASSTCKASCINAIWSE